MGRKMGMSLARAEAALEHTESTEEIREGSLDRMRGMGRMGGMESRNVATQIPAIAGLRSRCSWGKIHYLVHVYAS